MFIRLIYGESQTMILNPNCTARIFIDYIKDACLYDQAAIIDLCDEYGSLAHIHSKQPTDNIAHLVARRGTYMPVLIEKMPDDTIKNILPLLVDWDKKYPSLERKLKQQTYAADKPKKSANEGKGRRQREKEKMEQNRLGADASPSRRSSHGTPSEISTKPSQMGKRKK